MKRKLSVLCALALIVVQLAGCSSSSSSTSSTSSAASGSTGTSSTGETSTAAPEANSNMNEIGTVPIVKEKITLSAIQYIRDTDATQMDGLWYAEKLEEDTNIHIDYTQVNQSDWSTQMNLMFASGDYPDIIVDASSPKAINTEIYGVDQGIIVPVDDLVDQYMPVYKSRLEADTTPWMGLIKSDGHMYGIGAIADYGSNCGGEFFINQTWLDNLGLETPTTTDELYEVLKAFVTKDPNGNGQNDEIGYEGIFDELTTYMFYMWGIPETSRHFYINDDAQVIFTPEMPGYREALEWMSKLYTEGLMDPATMTQDSNSKISVYNQNNVGLTTMHRLKSMGWDVLEEDMVFLMTPAAEGYSVKHASDMSTASERVYFTVANEHLAESACWVDYQLTDQITFESYYGPEGTLWNWNDEGKCELGPAGDQGVMEYALGVNGIYYMPSYYYNDVFQQPDYRLERIEYCEIFEEAGFILKYPDEYCLNLATITADDQNTLNQIFVNLEALYDEAVADMIMHGVTDEKWNSFLERLTAAGSADYIAIYQKALDDFLAKTGAGA